MIPKMIFVEFCISLPRLAFTEALLDKLLEFDFF